MKESTPCMCFPIPLNTWEGFHQNTLSSKLRHFYLLILWITLSLSALCGLTCIHMYRPPGHALLLGPKFQSYRGNIAGFMGVYIKIWADQLDRIDKRGHFYECYLYKWISRWCRSKILYCSWVEQFNRHLYNLENHIYRIKFIAASCTFVCNFAWKVIEFDIGLKKWQKSVKSHYKLVKVIKNINLMNECIWLH